MRLSCHCKPHVLICFVVIPMLLCYRCNQLLLTVQVRCVPEGNYPNAQDVIWDCDNGATTRTLYNDISSRIGFLPSEFVVAKHFPKKYEWMIIENTNEVNFVIRL